MFRNSSCEVIQRHFEFDATQPSSLAEKRERVERRIEFEVEFVRVGPLRPGTLGRAELILLDAAKDGMTESKILANLQQVPFAKAPLLVMDDIRVWTMLKVWRDIRYPKLDLTSFGSWTGTGLVEWLG